MEHQHKRRRIRKDGILVIIASFFVLQALAQCHKNCNGRGTCDQSGVCQCHPAFTGPDCSLFACPYGTAWADLPIADDTAHALAECSNKGVCDRTSGACQCYQGFEGPSCNRMLCPNDCNGHGRCMNLAQASTQFDGFHLNRSTDYLGWDAEMIYGCICDAGFTGYDCSLKPCSKGPDPRVGISQYETITLKCQCGSTCSGGFRLAYQGRTSAFITPDASTSTIAGAILSLQNIYLSDTAAYTDYLTVSMSASRVCGTSSETQTDITFIKSPGNVPPFTILDFLTASTTKNIYMQTTQSINCTCGSSCGGWVSLSYDGMTTPELPYSASSAQVENALTSLSTLQSVYSLDVTAVGSTDQLCPHTTGSHGFKVVIKAQMGNLPALEVIGSLTKTYGNPGGNITITTNDADTPVESCNGIGKCNLGTGLCTCPLGYGFSTDRGDCGTLAINSSHWTGIETCPGNVDQSSLEEISAANDVLIYFTDKNRPGYNKTMSGIYIQSLDSPNRPVMLANLTQQTPGAIALDLSAREVYFIDTKYKAIGKQTIDVEVWANVSGSYQFNTTSYLATNLPYAPYDLALDLRFGYRHAYFTVPGSYSNGSHTLGKIMRMDLDDSHSVTTIVSNLDQPKGLALDLLNDKLYFTDARNSSASKIYRCSLDGADLKPIMSKYFNISMPSSIALDLVRRKAFVLTRTYLTGTAYIMSFDMDTNYTTIVNTTKPHFIAASNFGSTSINSSAIASTTTTSTVHANLSSPEHMVLDTVNQWIYYTDSYYNDLRRVNYAGTKIERIMVGQLYTPVGLAIDFGKGAPRDRDYYDCYGHGYCTGFSGQFQCVCHDGWSANCNIASCPKGKAWFDVPTDTTVAHALTECSNMGICDYKTGTCQCHPGYEGRACERLACPGWEKKDADLLCSGHGRCLTMAEIAKRAPDVHGNTGEVTYGLDPTVAETWDAHMIQQCYCDQFDYFVNGTDRLPPYVGPDCSVRGCTVGDNPNTIARNHSMFEVQRISCHAKNGTYSLTFRGQTTSTLPYNASLSQVTTALLQLGTLGSIELTAIGSSTKLCSTTGTAQTNITYRTELGRVPLVIANTVNLGGLLHVVRLQNSTKEAAVCADHGMCDGSMGKCQCFQGYSSSDYDGGVGTSGDCGYIGSRSRWGVFDLTAS